MRILTVITGPILITGIIITPTYGGINMFDRGPSESKSIGVHKSTVLKKAEEAFVKGDYEKVIVIGNNYLDRRSKPYDELQYLMGRAFLKLGQFNEGRNCFSKIINSSDNDEFLDNSYIGMADSHYLSGDYKKANEYYKKVVRYFPDSDEISIVYYRLGECNAKLGESSTSKEYYDKLIELYPESLEAKLLAGEKSDFVAYSVQAGSFKKWKNAKGLCDELKNKGFDAKISAVLLGNSRFYRVRVGQYNRLSDAEDMARNLRNKGYSTKVYP